MYKVTYEKNLLCYTDDLTLLEQYNKRFNGLVLEIEECPQNGIDYNFKIIKYYDYVISIKERDFVKDKIKDTIEFYVKQVKFFHDMKDEKHEKYLRAGLAELMATIIDYEKIIIETEVLKNGN